MQLIFQGYGISERSLGDPPDASRGGVMLVDAATGSRLAIDPATGRETRRVIESPEVSALFDQIMASIRRVDGVGAGGARAPVTTPPEPVTLRYDRLDIAGGATAAGSYAFLETAGDSTSAIGDDGYFAAGGVELRIHPTDASGASRAAFYETVQVGDRFDYQTNGVDCATRFRVTSVGTTAIPRTFGIEWVNNYGAWCAAFPDDPNATKDVHFVWKVPAGIPGPDGVRELLYGEPVGPGTYRIGGGVPCVIDVPVGSVIFYGGEIEHGPDPTGTNGAEVTVLLEDAGMTSGLHIDPDTCEEDFRVTGSADMAALFDQIMASIRRVE